HVPNASLPVNPTISISLGNSQNATTVTSRLEDLDNYGWWGITTIPTGSSSLCIWATELPKSSTCIDPGNLRHIWLDSTGTPFLSRVAATKNIKVHLNTSSKTGRFAVLDVNGAVQTQPFVRVGTDFIATFPVPATTTTYTIKTQSTRSKKLFDDTQPIGGDASKLSDIYLNNGVERIFASVAERSNLAIIHYNRPDNNYRSWGIHVWYDQNVGGAQTETLWARPKSPVSSKPDSWGVKFSIPLVAFTSKLPFIIHKGELKDPSASNQYLDLAKYGHEIWIESGKADAEGNFVIAKPQLPGQETTSEDVSLSEATALASDSPRSSFANDSIYFVMTDRYKNGDSTNDLGGTGSTNRNVSGFDATDGAWSHGGDLAGLLDGCNRTDGSGEGVPRIKKLGFSAIWITPPFKQNFVQGGSAAYHGYWINDFTQIDPRWGTNAQFKSFVDCAHRLGIKVVLDIVVNHTGDIVTFSDGWYGFRSTPSNRATIPAWASNLKAPSWLNDVNNYHNQGNISDWGNTYQSQNGDFYGLDDLKTESDTVINGFADVYSKWVNDFDVDGFRIDTAKHVDNQFFLKWWPKMAQQTAQAMQGKGQKLFAFGEFYDSNIHNQANYMRKYGLPSALDFTFQNRSLPFVSGGAASNIGDVFGNDNLFIAKDKSPYDLVTFLGNHDMGRVAYLLNQSGATRSQSVLLGHDLMFLTRGIPSVYYGDEVGMIGTGGDKSARQDMFPTQVNWWRSEDRVFGSSIGTGSSLTVTTPLTTRITQLNSLRKQHPALASGSQTIRSVDGNALVISRFDASSRTEYLVGFNSGNSAKSVSVITSTPSSQWQSLLSSATLNSGTGGEITFSIPARSTVIFKANSSLPQANDNIIVSLTANLDSANKSVNLSAGVPGSDLGTVTFAVKQNSGPWSVVGADDSRNFGMVWDYQSLLGTGLAPQTKLSIIAIYKSTTGKISVSGIKQLTTP
ncbi:MAG: alpha-amylase family glycosyl hydrolase, partial [Rhodoluna sp.]